MNVHLSFTLKEPKKKESLLYVRCRWNSNYVKVSTRQQVIVATWDKTQQLCITSKEKFTDRTNRQSAKVNKYLKELSVRLSAYFDSIDFDYDTTPQETVKSRVQGLIEVFVNENKEANEKKKITPIDFFRQYVEQKRIDPHTGRYIAERTKIHQRTVIHRLEQFLLDTNTPNEFSSFTSKKFDAQFTEWCYSVKNYKQNTVYATYGVLKPFLNAAKEEGFELDDNYKKLKGKGVDVDAIYLTEEEIERIYNLDIPSLIKQGEIDVKSQIEISRDLFIISCWTALRRSDINQLNKALFDVERKMIIVTAEKTKKQVVIPMHPMVFALWNKYDGKFPHLCDKGKTNDHLRECARHAKIDDDVRIVENRGGKVQTLTYKKYQLVGMHTGRRSFATNMYKRGFPTIAIMRLTGHTTEANFLKYIKVTSEEHAAMMSEEFYKSMKPFEEDGKVD